MYEIRFKQNINGKENVGKIYCSKDNMSPFRLQNLLIESKEFEYVDLGSTNSSYAKETQLTENPKNKMVRMPINVKNWVQILRNDKEYDREKLLRIIEELGNLESKKNQKLEELLNKMDDILVFSKGIGREERRIEELQLSKHNYLQYADMKKFTLLIDKEIEEIKKQNDYLKSEINNAINIAKEED